MGKNSAPSGGLTSFHKAKYGDWAGNPRGNEPDPSRCAEEVMDAGRGMLFSQCSRKRGHGPEGAFCKQHSPEAKAERQAKADERYQEETAKRRRQWSANKLADALRQIANGHNDPRGLASEVLTSNGWDA